MGLVPAYQAIKLMLCDNAFAFLLRQADDLLLPNQGTIAVDSGFGVSGKTRK